MLAARARANGETPKAKRSSSSRSTGSRRTHDAAAVLARGIAAGPFEAGILATARRLDELAAAADDIPFLGEPYRPRRAQDAAGMYGLQPAF